VIHTNMGQLGLEGKLGHADFYPNGGRIQERCYMFANPIAMIAEQVSGKNTLPSLVNSHKCSRFERLQYHAHRSMSISAWKTLHK
jgi:hypothetical protein